MKKALLFLFTCLFLADFSYAQDVVLEKNVEDQYKDNKGPNMRHFGHLYIGGGFIPDFDEVEGMAINGWRSGQFIFGYRYKVKLFSFYSLGFDLGFKMSDYYMAGDDANPFDSANPLSLTTGEKRQKFTNNGIGLEVFQRINIGKRGNKLGKYLDLGVRGQYNIANVEELVINYDNAPFVGRQRIYNRRLSYIEDFSYGFSGRIGYNNMAIYGFYRLSDLFRKDYNLPELPRLNIGFQFAIM